MTSINKKQLSATLLVTISIATTAYAGSETPLVDQRQENQERRIEQGVNSGRLTEREANRLEAQQNRIENAETRAKADGVVTRGERIRLAHRQNKASRNIYRKKHNWRNR